MKKSNRVIGLKPIDKLDKEREEENIVEKKLTKKDGKKFIANSRIH